MTAAGLIHRREGWLSAWVGPELVLMNGNTGSYVTVSATAGRIWEQLETPQSLDSLCALLAAEYAADIATIRSEAATFLRRMQAEGAIALDAACLA